MKKVVVTGGSGKAGRAVVRDLQEHGYEVLNVDLAPPAVRECPFLRADLTNHGEAVEAIAGAWAVVHLAAIPAPGLHAPEFTFRVNTTSTFNVFQAAMLHRVQRVVWASSETTLGLPFDRIIPQEVPIDETHFPCPETTYALSKVVGETMAEQYARWTRIPFVGLRISNIMEAPHDYHTLIAPGQKDPHARKWNFWGYVDARDVAQACRLGLTAAIEGSENMIIAAADTCVPQPNADLLELAYPDTKLVAGTGEHESLLSISKAKKLLGYAPKHSWRDVFR